jgi:hypothetical protein
LGVLLVYSDQVRKILGGVSRETRRSICREMSSLTSDPGKGRPRRSSIAEPGDLSLIVDGRWILHYNVEDDVLTLKTLLPVAI